jgi:hypothetical protein
MLADALLRTVAGTTVYLQVTGANPDTEQSELGLVANNFQQVAISPAVMRKLPPTWREGDRPRWEMLVSATSVEQQVASMNLASAQSLFAMTMSVTMAGQSYVIESIGANEAMGTVYLYRLLVREAGSEAL